MLHTPLPLPDIVMPTERFSHVMMPGLINPRSDEPRHGVIPQLIKSLDNAVVPSAIEMLKHRLPNFTNGALPSFHGPIIQLSGRSLSLGGASAGEMASEAKAESAVKQKLVATQSAGEAKKGKKALGKRKLSIKEHQAAGLD